MAKIALKTLNYNKTHNLKYSNLTYEISIDNYHQPINIVNSLRRTIMGAVPAYAFEPSLIVFNKNTSVANNDQLRERFSQLPIPNIDTGIYFMNPITDYKKYLESQEYINATHVDISLNVKNESNELVDITTNDIKFMINNQIVDSPYNKEYPITLLRLKQGQEIDCQLIGVIGCGSIDTIWSNVSGCYHKYDKENKITLVINSRGQVNEFVLFDKAVDNIIYNLELKSNTIKSYLSTITNKIDSFNVILDDMTIGQLINGQIQSDKRVVYSGIHRPSYLEKFVEMKIELDKEYDIKEIDKIIEENINVLIKMFKEMKELNKKEMKKFV